MRIAAFALLTLLQSAPEPAVYELKLVYIDPLDQTARRPLRRTARTSTLGRDRCGGSFFASSPARNREDVETFTTLLESGEADRVVSKKRELVAHHQRIARKVFGERMASTHPASPHIWLELDEQWDAQEFAQQAAVRGVSVAPASIFALERRGVPNAIRVSLGATPSAAELQGALTMLDELRPESRVQAGV